MEQNILLLRFWVYCSMVFDLLHNGWFRIVAGVVPWWNGQCLVKLLLDLCFARSIMDIC